MSQFRVAVAGMIALFVVAMTHGCKSKLRLDSTSFLRAGAASGNGSDVEFKIASPSSAKVYEAFLVSWSRVEDASYYDLIAATDSQCREKVLAAIDLTSNDRTIAFPRSGTFYFCVIAKTITKAEIATFSSATVLTVSPDDLQQEFHILDADLEVGRKKVRIRWAPVAGVSSYDLTIASDPVCEAAVQTYQGIGTNEITIDALPDGEYYVCVSGIIDGSTTVFAAQNTPSLIINSAAPGAFTISGPAAKSNSPAPRVTWSAAVNAVSYQLVIGTDASCANALQTFRGLQVTQKDLVGLADGTYHVCVSAEDAAGNVTAAKNNGYSFAKKTSLPGAFSIQGPVSPTHLTPDASWQASAGAVGYDLGIATDAACTSILRSHPGITATTFKLPFLAAGDYFLCASSYDGFGNRRTALNNGWPFSIPGPLLFGQADFDVNANRASGLTGNAGVFTDGVRLFVADRFNNRVLIWNTIPTSQRQADIVLGQSRFDTKDAGPTTASSLRSPQGVYSDGTHLFVADTDNSRVLIWTSMPTANNEPADVVVGQPDFTSNQGTMSASGLNNPLSVYGDGTHLFVADWLNSRVMIWNSIPSVNGAPADVVVGQSNFTSASYGCSASEIYGPMAVSSDGTRLFVADSMHDRVLVWNSIPTTNGAAADVAVGVPNMTTCSNFFTTASSLWSPQSIYSDGTRLYIADHFNGRVLKWNNIPTVSGAAADVAIGKPNKTTSSGGSASATNLTFPSSVSGDGTRIFVADQSSRVLVWNASPTADGSAADFAIGHAAMDMDASSNGIATGSDTLASPGDVFSDGTRLFVADSENNRVLIWNALPTSSQEPPDVVLGQPNFTSYTAGTSATEMHQPTGVYVAGSQLFVADSYNNRVLIWTSIPTTNGEAADLVIGQPDMTSNSQGTSATVMYYPYGVYSDGTRLYVADGANRRVLVWTSLPTANGEAADLVLGQPNMTDNTGSCGADRMWSPVAIRGSGTKVFVADSSGARVLIWNNPPTVNQQPADVVVGQPNLTDCSYGGSRSEIASTNGVFTDGQRLYVADSGNNRILVWNSIPTVSGAPADAVIGQPDFTSGQENNGGLSADSLAGPRNGYSDGVLVYIADTYNNRIITRPRP